MGTRLGVFRFAFIINSFLPRLITDNLRQYYLWPRGQRAFDYNEKHSQKQIRIRSLVHEKCYQQTSASNGCEKFCLRVEKAKIFFKCIKPCSSKERDQFASFIGLPVCCYTKTFDWEVTFVDLFRYLIGHIFQWYKWFCSLTVLSSMWLKRNEFGPETKKKCRYFHKYLLIYHFASNISDCKFDPVFVLTFTKREY